MGGTCCVANPSPQPPPRNGEGEKKRRVWLAPPLLAGEGVGGRGLRHSRRHTVRGHVLTEQDTLDGANVLPGLALAVKEVFARLPPAGGNLEKTTPPPGKKR